MTSSIVDVSKLATNRGYGNANNHRNDQFRRCDEDHDQQGKQGKGDETGQGVVFPIRDRPVGSGMEGTVV